MNNKLSILARDFLEPILEIAKKNLWRDGGLYPVLFVKDASGRVMARLLELPRASLEKQMYMVGLGRWLRQRSGLVVAEAVMMTEGWFVDAVKSPTPAVWSVPPSQHPARQEAITMVGRNAEGTRATSVIQIFRRDGANKPVWGELAMAVYNQPIGKGERMEGLLDYLFLEPKGGESYGAS